MITDTGVITEGGKAVGQIQLVTSENGDRRAQLYNSRGIFLAETPFVGDDDTGYEHGLSLYNGYVTGFNNAEYAISRAVITALNVKRDMEIG